MSNNVILCRSYWFVWWIVIILEIYVWCGYLLEKLVCVIGEFEWRFFDSFLDCEWFGSVNNVKIFIFIIGDICFKDWVVYYVIEIGKWVIGVICLKIMDYYDWGVNDIYLYILSVWFLNVYSNNFFFKSIVNCSVLSIVCFDKIWGWMVFYKCYGFFWCVDSCNLYLVYVWNICIESIWLCSEIEYFFIWIDIWGVSVCVLIVFYCYCENLFDLICCNF